MKKVRFTETQIISIFEAIGIRCFRRESGRATWYWRDHFYHWKAKYGGMEANEVKRMKELREENARLKRIVAKHDARDRCSISSWGRLFLSSVI